MTLTLFAIRHKATGEFLPELSGQGRGYTFTSPLPVSSETPRLFRSARAAKLALRAWLHGPYERVWETDEWGGGQVVVGTAPRATPPADRNPDEMEIIPVTLTWSEAA